MLTTIALSSIGMALQGYGIYSFLQDAGFMAAIPVIDQFVASLPL